VARLPSVPKSLSVSPTLRTTVILPPIHEALPSAQRSPRHCIPTDRIHASQDTTVRVELLLRSSERTKGTEGSDGTGAPTVNPISPFGVCVTGPTNTEDHGHCGRRQQWSLPVERTMVSGVHSSCGRRSIGITINPRIPIICGVFILTLPRASNNTGEQASDQ
jgi:hypothetical protein